RHHMHCSTFPYTTLFRSRVTGRNTPSVINAVFNVRNFWDGRANRRFNGRNPFGDADPNARVLEVTDLGELAKVHVSLNNASLSRSEEHTSELQSRFDIVC